MAKIANLIGDQARSQMLLALMGGKALTASELASEANITAQTASNHLAKLVEAYLLVVRKQGRHKYFQLRNHEVAEVIEKLLNLSSLASLPNINTGPSDPDLRKARICYDHLAGEVGVTIYDALLNNSFITEDDKVSLTEVGEKFFRKLGVETESLKKKKRPLCKSCLDWSERRYHLAGTLGQWILTDVLNRQWATKDLNSRCIRFTTSGLLALERRYKA